MSLPKYPAYKNSGVEWLGNVPRHWAVESLKRGFTVIGGSTPKSDEAAYWNGDLIWVSPADLSRLPSLYIATSARKITQAGLRSCGTTLVPPGSIVLSTRAPIGSLAIATTALCTNQGCKSLVPHKDAHSIYFAYVLLSATTPLNLRGKGTTFLELSADELAAFKGPAPPLDEQAAIAAFLDNETAKIDALIAEQEKLISLLAEKRRATISHVVMHGRNPNAPMGDSGVAWLGNVPTHWQVIPLKHFGRIGNGSTPNRDNADYWAEDGFAWLNSSVVNQDEVSEAQQFVTAKALDECHLPIVTPPAVLVGITGQGKTRGMVARLCLTATVNQHLAYIKPDERRLSVPYLARVLEAAYDHLRTESEGAGSTKGAITCDQLGRLRITAPSIKEQGEIVEFLTRETSKLNGLVSAAESAIGLLKERRSALIAAAVTGQIDVRGAVPQSIEHEELAA
jgi:type I restriction enzyme, S subunit